MTLASCALYPTLLVIGHVQQPPGVPAGVCKGIHEVHHVRADQGQRSTPRGRSRCTALSNLVTNAEAACAGGRRRGSAMTGRGTRRGGPPTLTVRRRVVDDKCNPVVPRPALTPPLVRGRSCAAAAVAILHVCWSQMRTWSLRLPKQGCGRAGQVRCVDGRAADHQSHAVLRALVGNQLSPGR